MRPPGGIDVPEATVSRSAAVETPQRFWRKQEPKKLVLRFLLHLDPSPPGLMLVLLGSTAPEIPLFVVHSNGQALYW